MAETLPSLRLVARLVLPDPMSADRLVEETLLRAIDCGPPEHGETAEWLHRLLQ